MASLSSAFSAPFDPESSNAPAQPIQPMQQAPSLPSAQPQEQGGGGPFSDITGKEPYNTDPRGVAMPMNPAVNNQSQIPDQRQLHEQRMQRAKVEIDNRFREIAREEQKGLAQVFFVGGVVIAAFVVYHMMNRNNSSYRPMVQPNYVQRPM